MYYKVVNFFTGNIEGFLHITSYQGKTKDQLEETIEKKSKEISVLGDTFGPDFWEKLVPLLKSANIEAESLQMEQIEI